MKIEIEEHDPYWKLYYLKEEQRILKGLKEAHLSSKIAHIGSTSVPALAAKPTIDVLLGLRKGQDLEALIPVFKKLGYIYVSKYNEALPERRFFIKIKAISPLQKWTKKEIGLDDPMPPRKTYKRVFHIHAVYEDTDFYKRHLAFRNHLRKSDADREAYQALKIHLGNLDWESGNDYAQAKSGFIEAIMAQLEY